MTDTRVAIVGAGPAGMLLSHLLGRGGTYVATPTAGGALGTILMGALSPTAVDLKPLRTAHTGLYLAL